MKEHVAAHSMPRRSDHALEGTVRSKLHATPASTYHQDVNGVEQPGAHHVLRKNTSQTKRAAGVQ